MKRKFGFYGDTFVAGILVYMFIFYFTYLFMVWSGLLTFQILITAAVASASTTYFLYKLDKNCDIQDKS